jgi:hypothetical protein
MPAKTNERRRRLPYAAGELIDDALGENQLAVKALMLLIDGKPTTAEERYRLIGKAIHHIHESTAALREVPKQSMEDQPQPSEGSTKEMP